MKIIKSTLHNFGRWYGSEVCRREYRSQEFYRINERPVELSFVFRHLSKACPRKVLDVGTGTTALPQLMRNCGFLVTAIDNVRDYWPSGMFNRHCHVINDDITDTRIDETFDFITCISVLEHIEAYDKAIANMFKLLKTNGCLALTFPYNEKRYVSNVYQLAGAGYGQDAPYICQAFSRNEIEKWLTLHNARMVDQEFWQFWEGEFWTLGDQITPPRQVTPADKHQFTCLLLQKIR